MNNKNQRIISIVFSLVSIIVIHLPWFVIDGDKYNLFQGYMYLKKSDISDKFDDPEQVVFYIKVQVIMVLLYEIVCICYILTVLFKKNLHLNIAAMLFAVALVGYPYGLQELSDNMTAILFPYLFAIINGFEILIIKLMKAWKDAVKEAEESAQRERIRKEEEKRRLSFPGNYTELFFRMIWKNFKYDWRDYSLLLMCSTVVAALSFAGIGCYQMMSQIHREENFLIGQGLGRIVWNAMIPLAACAVFLMVFMMIFYLGKWMESYSIFMTLGIRKKALYIILALEIIIGFVISVLSGCLLGNGLLFLFRRAICHSLGTDTMLSQITFATCLKMTGVMVIIYVVSLLATQSIVSDFNLINASTRRIRREKMPGKRLKIMTAIGCVFLVGSIILYGQITRHESIYLLCIFFTGLFLIIRYGGAAYLRREQKKQRYVTSLMKQNHLYHKSKTTAWYLTALTVLNICAVFYFTFQIVSVSITEEPETLFPYDFVCIADEGDDEFFAEMEEKYDVNIISYPMVRVANADKTERLEGIGVLRPQGQQIGISETTFHQLKKNLDRNYQEELLDLDENGEKVYVVHQQDRSVKAQPVDWTYGSEKPFLHIGLPCASYNMSSPSNNGTYIKREISGEEIGSLIGCFRQGNLENIIVFSDAYFEKAQEMWKYTDIEFGNWIEDEEMRIEGVNIRQGPTKLVLINAEPEDVDALEQEMEVLKANHTYEAKYDGEVSCYYSRKTAIDDMKTEHVMKQIVNFSVVIVLVMTSVFLIYVKTISEMDEKKKRADFLKCMGMRKKERIRILKGELYLFYRVPALITVAATIFFTAATFHARMYTGEVIKAYLRNAVWIWIGWILIEGAFVVVLGQWFVRKVEGKNE